ncbi:hypothetical protein Clacol_008652 [Clathrus columnatus]|uniref:Extracellular membrane protein CFEM domain-containing protein n=1 Tax=Clathrus columnatus TaxID=1419009 RepID=A0AAV5ALN3_9AGAM|nr:hypothetical protein Clacol_008652 [Clathrus columnatus]
MLRLLLQILFLTAFVSALVTREPSSLRARQLGGLEPADVPSECTATCSPFFTEIQTCGTENSACLCTSAVEQAGIECLDCIAAVLPSTLQSLQSATDQSVLQCQEEGHPIAPATIVGEQIVGPTNPPAAASPPTASDSPTSGSSGTTSAPAKSNAYALSGYLHPLFITLLSVGSVFFLGVY